MSYRTRKHTIQAVWTFALCLAVALLLAVLSTVTQISDIRNTHESIQAEADLLEVDMGELHAEVME